MKIAYFDCFNGAAGDMILGALIDAGLSADELCDTLAALPIDGYRISVERVTKQSLSATRFDVALDPDAAQPHRHLADITEIIEAAPLSTAVQARAAAIFERLANAEARVHGTTVDKIHFHEVGAVDAIIDIVGVCWAMERLGIERIACSPIPVGSGTVHCAHGVLPVPAPATAILLEGVPIAATDEVGELTTPTGAAVLTELADAFGPIPSMTPTRIGMGAGRRDGNVRPNVLRVFLGEASQTSESVFDGLESDQIVVLEANIDDSTPEVLGYVIERLLESGALDAYCLPIYMKKSRPAMLLTVLAESQRVAELQSIVFAETTTFGIRRRDVCRAKLARRVETVETPHGPVRIKVGTQGDRVVTVAPEYDDCRRAAARSGIPLRLVMAEARDAWHRSAGES